VFAARFEGSAGAARAQADRAAQVAARAGGKVSLPDGEAEARFWGGFPAMAATGEGDVLARVAAPRAALAGVLERPAREAASRGMAVATWAHVGHGHTLLRAAAPGDADALEWLRAVRGEAERQGGALVVWRASAGVRASFDVWGNPGEGLELMRRVKAQFDPNNTLNPGRFAGGI
jgi:glycolate oxidase FAD binding subunit